MEFPSHVTRGEDKLAIILRQVGSLRTRLNSLALQDALYRAVATILACGAIILVSLYWMPPLSFLVTAAVTFSIGLVGLWRAARAGWRMRANMDRAAAVADDRADLKGRLATVVATAPRANRGALWDYLLEDTLGHSDNFQPARIERRRIARSLWAPAAAMLLAILAIPIARMHRVAPLPVSEKPGDMTIDLDDLHFRAAEPGDDDGIEVQADASTMRQLEAKMAREGVAPSKGSGDAASGFIGRARKLAGQVQGKLRGEVASRRRMTLKLAQDDNGLAAEQPRGSDDWQNRRRSDPAGQFERDRSPGDEDTPLALPDLSQHANQSQMASNDEGQSSIDPNEGKNTIGDAESAARASSSDSSRSDRGSSGGPSHGSGADPDSLFGAPTNTRMTTEGFEISIEARPMERGVKGAGQAYLPPKVRTPLNSTQHADEPVARASVPADDRATIQRVFER